MTLTVGSLFSGIGGLELGLEWAGMQTAWQVELDDYAQRILHRHWPNVPKHRDIRACGRHNLAPVDLICGGFPCQPHSLAGRRGGSHDERDLWPEYRRILRELRPRWVVAENVPGLLSTDAGQFFGAILADLATLGYDAEWSVLSACALGAPHTRERLFLVAHARRLGSFRWRIGEGGTGRNQASDCCDRPLQGAFWTCDPDPLCRVVDGISRRLDKGKRLKVLGNAVVPQVAEVIGRLILASEGKEP